MWHRMISRQQRRARSLETIKVNDIDISNRAMHLVVSISNIFCFIESNMKYYFMLKYFSFKKNARKRKKIKSLNLLSLYFWTTKTWILYVSVKCKMVQTCACTRVCLCMSNPFALFIYKCIVLTESQILPTLQSWIRIKSLVNKWQMLPCFTNRKQWVSLIHWNTIRLNGLRFNRKDSFCTQSWKE